MKILFTGGSSFTGFWFARQLAHAGHDVVAIFRKQRQEYEGLRAARVEHLASSCHCVYGCTFGDVRFMELVGSESAWNVLCHHAADVTNYKSPDFQVLDAVASNTNNLTSVLDALASKACQTVVLTGSVFEPAEGAGSEGLPAFSPYGLSKALTDQVFRYYCETRKICLGKFVISNPFGPYEEPRFTAYLVRSWYEGKTPTVNMPAYVRDNIHVSLLAKAYVHFTEHLGNQCGFQRINPSGYPSSQGAFTQFFSERMRERLQLPCNVTLAQQTEFTEPRVRINTDLLDPTLLQWHEDNAWDELADYYRVTFGRGK